MILTKENFEVIRAASDDETRLYINGMLAMSDGTTVASNGAMMFRVSPSSYKDDEYPEIKYGDKTMNNGDSTPITKDVFINTPVAKLTLAQLRKRKRTLPILKAAELVNVNGKPTIFATDLDTPVIYPVPDAEEALRRDQVESILKQKDAEFKFSIRLRLDVLQPLIEFVRKTQYTAPGGQYIDFDFTGPKSAVYFQAGETDTNQKIDGVIMPANRD
ncbi:MAG: hypothetical protein WC356_04325 [Candidatus Micrarchaeia archaeon]|jgi:hypothetical protein